MLGKNPILKVIIVVLMMIPLAFSGGSFLTDQEHTAIKVGRFSVPQAEFQLRYESYLNEILRDSGIEEDLLAPSVKEQIAQQVAEQYISFYMVQEIMREKEISISDAELLDAVRSNSDFIEDGNFSPRLFDELVSDEEEFFEQTRSALLSAHFVDWFEGHNIISSQVAERMASFYKQQRLVEIIDYDILDLLESIDVSEDELRTRYETVARTEFQLPEQAQAEYLLFDLSEFAVNEEVSDTELMELYRLEKAALDDQKQRKVSHILIEATEGQDEAFMKAKQLLSMAEKNPESFKDLAIEHSDDFGSSQNGGELGLILPGDLEAKLENVIFEMEVGEIAGPIETESGFHILKLDGLLGSSVPSFEEMREDLARRKRNDKSYDLFYQKLDEMKDLAYVEVNRLSPVADVGQVSLTVSDWFERDPESSSNIAPFNNIDLLDALFSSSSTETGNNTDAIEIGENQYVIARLVGYREATLQPFEEVKDTLSDELKRIRAIESVVDRVQAIVSALEEDDIFYDDIPPESAWGDRIIVTLDDEPALELNETAVNLIFAADFARGLPAYVIVPKDDGLQLIRIISIIEGDPSREDIAEATERLASTRALLEQEGYLGVLREKIPISTTNL